MELSPAPGSTMTDLLLLPTKAESWQYVLTRGGPKWDRLQFQNLAFISLFPEPEMISYILGRSCSSRAVPLLLGVCVRHLVQTTALALPSLESVVWQAIVFRNVCGGRMSFLVLVLSFNLGFASISELRSAALQ